MPSLFQKTTLLAFCVYIYRFVKLIFELYSPDFYFGVDFGVLRVYYLIINRQYAEFRRKICHTSAKS